MELKYLESRYDLGRIPVGFFVVVLENYLKKKTVTSGRSMFTSYPIYTIAQFGKISMVTMDGKLIVLRAVKNYYRFLIIGLV